MATKPAPLAWDIGDIAQIPAFAERYSVDRPSFILIPPMLGSVKHAHPDIACVFFNAGTQSVIDLSDPSGFNEVFLNFTSLVALTNAFLPFSGSSKSRTMLFCKVYASILQPPPPKKNPKTPWVHGYSTSSNLAIVPLTVAPAYSASRAALNVFTLSLREALQKTNVQVIELSPPPVQTELHDYMGEKGHAVGMPLAQFTGVAHQGLLEGRDQIIVGAIGPEESFSDIAEKRRASFKHLAQVLRSLPH
ncbi:hypothetical protein N7512_005280 [Penicillium capsulatum]|nr:hypothetical protein N7512_005280 [Penicillium capsulatum]